MAANKTEFQAGPVSFWRCLIGTDGSSSPAPCQDGTVNEEAAAAPAPLAITTGLRRQHQAAGSSAIAARRHRHLPSSPTAPTQPLGSGQRDFSSVCCQPVPKHGGASFAVPTADGKAVSLGAHAGCSSLGSAGAEAEPRWCQAALPTAAPRDEEPKPRCRHEGPRQL